MLFSSLVSKKATICLRNYTLFLTLLASTYNSLDSWKNDVFSSIQSVQQFIHKMCCSKFIQARSWRKNKTCLVKKNDCICQISRLFFLVRSLIFYYRRRISTCFFFDFKAKLWKRNLLHHSNNNNKCSNNNEYVTKEIYISRYPRVLIS